MRQVLERVQSQRPPPARAHQRRARPGQDRGRATHAVARRLFAQGGRQRRDHRRGAAGGRQSSSPFKADVPANLPAGHGDERRIAQVLLNLVGNAIKFTDAGEVADQGVRGRTARSRSRSATTGPGIGAADQAKIFDEFQQADSSSTKKKGGTGLGLSIAKRIIEMHSGTNLGRVEARARDRPSSSRFRSRSSNRAAQHEQAHPGGRGSGGQPADPARPARPAPGTRSSRPRTARTRSPPRRRSGRT